MSDYQREVRYYKKIVHSITAPCNGLELENAITAAEQDLEEHGVQYYSEAISVTVEGGKIVMSSLLPVTIEDEYESKHQAKHSLDQTCDLPAASA